MTLRRRPTSDDRRLNERGEMASWLILGAALAAIASLLSPIIRPIIEDLARQIGAPAGGEVAAEPAPRPQQPQVRAKKGPLGDAFDELVDTVTDTFDDVIEELDDPDGFLDGVLDGFVDGVLDIFTSDGEYDPSAALAALGIEGLREEFAGIDSDEDLAAVAEFFFAGLEGLSDEEAGAFLDDLYVYEFLALLSAGDVPNNPVVIERLLEIGAYDRDGGPEFLGLLIDAETGFDEANTLEIFSVLSPFTDLFTQPLVNLFGDDGDAATAAILEGAYADILSQPGGYENLVAAFNGQSIGADGTVLETDVNPSSDVSPELGAALFEHLLANPETLAREIAEAQTGARGALELQNILEQIDEGSADILLGSHATSVAAGVDFNDPDARADWANEVGQLQFQLNEVGNDASFNVEAALVAVLQETVDATVPGGGILAAPISGIEFDTTTEDLQTEGAQDRETLVLAITVVAANDPVLAGELVAVLDPGSGVSVDEAIDIWVATAHDTETFDLVQLVQEDIDDAFGRAG